MAGKLVKGILEALDERLAERLGSKTAGKSLAGMAKISRSPVKGILAAPVDPRAVHPDFLTGKKPLWEMLHGSNSPQPFDRPYRSFFGDPAGLHLTRSPDTAESYGTRGGAPSDDYVREHTPNPSGSRVYPMLVDPGRVRSIPVDPGPFQESVNVGRSIFQDTNARGIQRDKELNAIMSDLLKHQPLEDVFKKHGYDSFEYPHYNPHKRYPQDYGHGLVLFDETRAVPEFDPIAQSAKKKRGVLTKWVGTGKDLGDEEWMRNLSLYMDEWK
jgi:hypothetical protein